MSTSTRLSSTIHASKVGSSGMLRLIRESSDPDRQDAVITLTPHAEAALLELLLARKSEAVTR